MAKFLPNYQPVTWKNVNTGNPAQFFNGAIQGGDAVFDQQSQINDQEDIYRTNEALNADRLGIPRAFDRRVDQEKRQQATGYEKTLKSNLLQASDQHLLDQEELKNAPLKLKAYQAEVQAKINSAESAAERNRLLGEAAKVEKEALDRKLLLEGRRDEYNNEFQSQSQGLYQQYLGESVTAKLGPGGKFEDLGQAEQDYLHTEAKSRADHDMARKVTGGALREQLNTPVAAFQLTDIYGQQQAAQQRNVTEDELRRKIEGEKTDIYSSNLEGAISGDLMSGGLDSNGNFVPIDPKSQVMKGGEFNSMVQGKARLNSEVDFVYSELTPENKKSLSDVASTLPADVLRKLTDNVMEARKEAGSFGTMSGDEFASKFIDAAYEYQQGYKSRVDTYTGANQARLTPQEKIAIAANKVKVSDEIAKTEERTPKIKLAEPADAQDGLTKLNAATEQLSTQIDTWPIELRRDYDVGHMVTFAEDLLKSLQDPNMSYADKQKALKQLQPAISRLNAKAKMLNKASGVRARDAEIGEGLKSSIINAG